LRLQTHNLVEQQEIGQWANPLLLQEGTVLVTDSTLDLTWTLLRVTKAAQEESWRQATKETMLSFVFEQISKTLDFTTARLAVSKIHKDSLQSADTERILL
jgi:hypothetical protein